MEMINDYGRYRDNCSRFLQEYTEKYLPEGQLVCHPLIKDLIFAVCSDEEAKRNDATICRLSDMMLMSEDGENDWKPFKLAEAREIASVNEHIFLSDLLFTSTFIAHDWMIDGKHDQLIVSEQYMREHNKPYAPVTPLTNMRMKIKKIINPRFWKEGTLENPAIVTIDDIQQILDEYLNEKLSAFPVLSSADSIKLPVGSVNAVVSGNSAKKLKMENALNAVYELKAKMEEIQPIFTAIGFGMTVSGYTIKFAVAALQKNDIEINAAEFRNTYYMPEFSALAQEHSVDDELECIKKAFIKAYTKNNKCGFTYAEADNKAYNEKLKAIEDSDMTGNEILAAAADILSEKPADSAVFRMLYANFSADSESISAAEEFWFGKKTAYSDEALNKRLSDNYVSADMKDESGFTCGMEKAKVIRSNVKNAADKYRFSDCPLIAELDSYIEELDKKQRTYNGTVFASADEMKKAMANELELKKLCTDLTALDKNELEKLRKYIYDSTADDKTKAKYLVKVKVAMNNCEENALAQMCLGLAALSADEASELINKIKSSGYDEIVAKSYISAVEDRIISAQAEELTAEFKDIENKSAAEIDALYKKTESGSSCDMLKKHFLRKAQSAKNNIARKELDSLCAGLDGMDKAKLAELKKSVEDKGYSPYVSGAYIRKIAGYIDNYDKKEVDALFADISKADKAALDKLRSIINEGKYATELTDPYISKISEREKAIENEAVIARCEKIRTMDKADLALIKADFTSGKFDSSITDKYSAHISAREVELEKAEIADMCKDIAKLGREELDKLEKQLSNEKYNKEHTAEYIKKIGERRIAAEKEELAELCKGISEMKAEELTKLSEKLSDNKFHKEYTEEYFAKIKERRIAVEKAEIADIAKGIAAADKAALKAISDKLSDGKYNKEYTAAYFEQIKKRQIELDNAEVAELCKNVGTMNRADLKILSEKISDEKYNKEYTKQFFDKIAAREIELDKAELTELCKNVATMAKADLEKLMKQISEKYKKETYAPFADKIRAREIELMKNELENLCKNIPSTPRAELSKLKEALKSGEFDKELSAKYISQIEQREAALIKTEVETLCKNFAAKDKEGLIKLKRSLTETPEFAAAAKSYIEQIDTRLKKLDKEEFDKMMTSIDKMNSEELEKFRENVEKRKPALENAVYINTMHSIDMRFDQLEKEELAKLCSNVQTMTIEQIGAALNTIEDKGYDTKNAAPFIKKLNDAATNIHVKNLSAITDNLNGLTKPELIAVLDKIVDYGHGCPEDMKKRYEGKVNSKIREVEDKQVEAMCRNLNNMTMKSTLELIDKIKAMDIDDSAKTRHINTCKLHITNDKVNERKEYTAKLQKDMTDNGLTDAFFVIPTSKSFDNYFVHMNDSFAKTGEFELPLVLHKVNPNNFEEGFVFTMDNVFCRNKNGLITKKSIDEIASFSGKKALFGGGTLKLMDKDNISTELPNNGFKPSNVETVAKVLNQLLGYINERRQAEKMRIIEENANRMNSMNEPAPVPAPAPKPAAPAPAPAAAKPAPVPVQSSDIKPLKPIEPLKETVNDVVAKAEVEVIKPIKPIEPISTDSGIVKPAAPAPAPKPAAAPAPVPAPAPAPKPAAPAPKPAAPAPKPAAPAPVPAPKPAAPAPAPAPKPAAPAPAPASAKPIKMKFCDQCGAKITSDTAKFCSECGNKIAR